MSKLFSRLRTRTRRSPENMSGDPVPEDDIEAQANSDAVSASASSTVASPRAGTYTSDASDAPYDSDSNVETYARVDSDYSEEDASDAGTSDDGEGDEGRQLVIDRSRPVPLNVIWGVGPTVMDSCLPIHLSNT